MRNILMSLAALALIGGGAPALAKKGGHGHAHSHKAGKAHKHRGFVPPGHARKLGIGERLPSHLSRYNVPPEYRDRYRDTGEHAYRYEDEQIYRVDRRSGVIEQIISVLGF